MKFQCIKDLWYHEDNSVAPQKTDETTPLLFEAGKEYEIFGTSINSGEEHEEIILFGVTDPEEKFCYKIYQKGNGQVIKNYIDGYFKDFDIKKIEIV